MENSDQLINKYIEKLNEELVDATKRRIVVEAQLAVQAFNNESFLKQLEELKSEAEALQQERDEEINRLVQELNAKQKEVDLGARERAEISNNNLQSITALRTQIIQTNDELARKTEQLNQALEELANLKASLPVEVPVAKKRKLRA